MLTIKISFLIFVSKASLKTSIHFPVNKLVIYCKCPSLHATITRKGQSRLTNAVPSIKNMLEMLSRKYIVFCQSIQRDEAISFSKLYK